MKSIHIENLETYSNEEIASIVNDLNNIIIKRKEEKKKEAFERVKNALTEYFEVTNSNAVEIDFTDYSLTTLLECLKNDVY